MKRQSRRKCFIMLFTVIVFIVSTSLFTMTKINLSSQYSLTAIIDIPTIDIMTSSSPVAVEFIEAESKDLGEEQRITHSALYGNSTNESEQQQEEENDEIPDDNNDDDTEKQQQKQNDDNANNMETADDNNDESDNNNLINMTMNNATSGKQNCLNVTPMWPLEKLNWSDDTRPPYFSLIEGSTNILRKSLQKSISLTKGYTLPKQIKYAVCKFRHKGLNWGNHFPHAMQQLYLCLSWWILNINKPGILVFDFNYKYKKIRNQKYTHGMVNAFRDVLNITIVTNTTKPYIQSIGLHNYKMYEPPSIFRNGCINFYNITTKTPSFIYRNNTTISNTTFDYHSNDEYHNEEATKRRLEEQEKVVVKKEESSIMMHHNEKTNDDNASDGTSTKLIQLPRIGILNRALDETRSIRNVDQLQNELVQMMTKLYNDNSNVTVEYFDHKTFLEQIQFFMEHDIIISPHGAQLTSIPFMPIDTGCSIIIEFFPNGFYMPYFFGSLAISSNIRHYAFYCSSTHYSIINASNDDFKKIHRRQKFCLPIIQVVQEIQQLIEEWIQCMSSSSLKS